MGGVVPREFVPAVEGRARRGAARGLRRSPGDGRRGAPRRRRLPRQGLGRGGVRGRWLSRVPGRRPRRRVRVEPVAALEVTVPATMVGPGHRRPGVATRPRARGDAARVGGGRRRTRAARRHVRLRLSLARDDRRTRRRDGARQRLRAGADGAGPDAARGGLADSVGPLHGWRGPVDLFRVCAPSRRRPRARRLPEQEARAWWCRSRAPGGGCRRGRACCRR